MNCVQLSARSDCAKDPSPIVEMDLFSSESIRQRHNAVASEYGKILRVQPQNPPNRQTCRTVQEHRNVVMMLFPSRLFAALLVFPRCRFTLIASDPSSIQGGQGPTMQQDPIIARSPGVHGKSSLRTSDHGNLAMRRISRPFQLLQTTPPLASHHGTLGIHPTCYRDILSHTYT